MKGINYYDKPVIWKWQ